jgi:hypothetical protein
VGSAPKACFSSTGETTTRETETVTRVEPLHAGGPEDTLRSIRNARGRSPQNGKTVACRGAGQSARITFCLSMIGFIVAGRRTPGGIHLPDTLLC